jgi:hypothetical protein
MYCLHPPMIPTRGQTWPGSRGTAALLQLLLVFAVGCSPETPAPPKVAIFGIDGAEWSVIEPLIAQDRLPALARLMQSGTRGKLETFTPTLSPALWTTISTGVHPSDHGIHGFAHAVPTASFLLPSVPHGDLQIVLDLAIDRRCSQAKVVGSINGQALTSDQTDPGTVRLRVPVRARSEGRDRLTLALSPSCPAIPKGEPWAQLHHVRVAVDRQNDAVLMGPDAIARSGTGVMRAQDEDHVSLVGRRLVQVQSSDRTAPALWNIASTYHRSSLIVGLWATWPSEKIRGTMISDFLLFDSVSRTRGIGRDREQGLARSATPQWARDIVEARLASADRFDEDDLAQFVPRGSSRFGSFMAAPSQLQSLGDPPIVLLKESFMMSRFYLDVAEECLERGQPDLLFIYTNLVDAIEHKFWKFYEPERFENVAATEIADFRDTIPAAYRYTDQRMGTLLEKLDPRTIILVVSDHGHHATFVSSIFSGHHTDGPPGILVAAGPGVRRGAEITGARIIDVAPTVLALLGIPVAKQLPGRVLQGLFDEPLAFDRIGSYGRGAERTPPDAREMRELGESVEERLRSLGYLEDQ